MAIIGAPRGVAIIGALYIRGVLKTRFYPYTNQYSLRSKVATIAGLL